jgi:transcription antitermination factor NusG
MLRGDTEGGTAWWTLQTSPHHELHVCKHLSALGLECYAPEFAPPRNTCPGSVRDGRHRWVFPGYVFLRSSTDLRASTRVRWVPGVVRVLEQDGAPAPLSDTVIRQLRQRIADRALRGPEHRFTPGERVLIQRGPLARLDAIFDQELNASDRVQILITLLGRQLPVGIDPTHLRSMAG